MKHRLFQPLLLGIAAALVYFSSAFLPSGGEEKAGDPDGPARQDRVREIEQWLYSQRAYPGTVIPDGAYESALAHVKKMNSSPFQKTLGGWNWVPLGPTNIAGRIRDIAVNPQNPSIVYIAAAGGGVWKTTNEGSTWSPLTDFMPMLRIDCLDMHPTNPDILLAGCGEGWVVWQGGLMWGKGIYRTNDGGASWTLIPSTNANQFQYVYDVAFDPFNPTTILAATDAGVYRSSDDGATWSRKLPFGTATAIQVEFGRKTQGLVYGVLKGRSISKSTDAGLTWSDITTGKSAIDATSFSRIEIAVAPSDDRILLASYITSASSEACIGIYKTTDAGSNWTKLSIPTNEYNNDTYVGAQGTYNNILRFHPTDPTIVYAGGIDLYRSNTGGASWSRISNAYTPFGVYVHPDHHAIAFNPSTPRIMYFGNDGGIVRSVNGGGGFSPINSGLSITQFHSVAPHPTSDRVLGGTIDNGNLMQTSGTSYTDVTGGDGGYTIIDPTNPNYVYAEMYFGSFFRSVNGGLHYNDFSKQMNGIPMAPPGDAQYPGTTDPVNFFAPFDMDPNNTATLYLGTYRIFKTTDRGSSWTAVSTTLGGILTTLHVCKADSRVLYAGSTGGIVAVSTDAGSNWSTVRSGLPNRYVTDIQSDYTNAATVYVCFSGFGGGHLFKSTNSGQSWKDISGTAGTGLPDAPANTVAVNPVNPNRLYVGTDVGAFESADGGATWQILDQGMGNVTVSDLRFRQDGTLFAATHGRGIFKSSYSLLDTQNLASPAAFRLEQNFPNPFNPGTFIRYAIGSRERVTMQVFNLTGQLVRTLVDQEMYPGSYTVEFDGRGFASGMYLYRLTAGGNAQTRSMMMVK